jgi:hypothetical protein
MRRLCLIYIAASVLGCQSSTGDSGSLDNATDLEDSDQISIEEEIESLNTDSQKITFQRLIIKSDLDMRKDQTKALQTHGYNSSEYQEATKIVEQTDKDNFAKTKGFIVKYGVSENQSVGRMQSEAMWLVMSHNSSLEDHRNMFSALQQAWKKEYLEESAFASYLQDFHQLKNGKMLGMKNPYRSDDEIKALMTALNLENQ